MAALVWGRCAADREPHQFDKERAGILCNLSEMVVRQLEAAWAEEYQKKCAPPAACWRPDMTCSAVESGTV